MKILVLSSHTPSLFWFRRDMMRAFIERGAQVFAAGQGSVDEWGERFAAEGVVYRQIPVSRNGLNVLADIKTFNALRRLIAEVRPDKIFTYQAKTIVYGTLASRLIDRDIEVYPLVAGLGSIFRSGGLKNRIVKGVLSMQYKIVFKYSKKVIFQNNDDRKDIVDLGLLHEDQTVIVNGSGVNMAKFPQTPLPAQKGILYIGRLIGDKGIREYLAVAKRIKACDCQVRCMVVGPFDSNLSAISQDELQPYIDNGIIEYFGEQKDVRPYLNDCTVYVLPSYHEGTPKTVLEAMSTGRPVVTSDAPGCRETVVPGVNGYLVPVKDVDAIETAVKKILYDDSLAKAFGNASRKIAEEKYDVNKVNADILSIMNL